MAATLRDVARRAGVSTATVSRVASGSVAVRRETRERVESAMRELLYVPPRRKTATGAIGLLVPELANPIFPALAQAMEARATAAGLATMLGSTTAAAFREVDYVHMLLDRQVDGFVFISCEMTHVAGDHGHYAQLLADGARIVFVNGSLDALDVPSVSIDERHAGQLATQHLIELGHRRIGFIAGPADYLPTREKAAGRTQALSEAGIGANGLVAHAEFAFEGGRHGLRELLAPARERPTAVVCSSDIMAIGVLREAREQGLRVPEDLSVVGFDGTEAAEWVDPPLTTIEQPVEQIADRAVDALQSLILDRGGSLPSFVFRGKLRRGRSTGPPPCD